MKLNSKLTLILWYFSLVWIYLNIPSTTNPIGLTVFLLALSLSVLKLYYNILNSIIFDFYSFLVFYLGGLIVYQMYSIHSHPFFLILLASWNWLLIMEVVYLKIKSAQEKL